MIVRDIDRVHDREYFDDVSNNRGRFLFQHFELVLQDPKMIN